MIFQWNRECWRTIKTVITITLNFNHFFVLFTKLLLLFSLFCCVIGLPPSEIRAYILFILKFIRTREKREWMLFELEKMFFNQDSESVLSDIDERRAGRERQRAKVPCFGKHNLHHPTTRPLFLVALSSHTMCGNTHTHAPKACAFEHSLSNIDSYWRKLP